MLPIEFVGPLERPMCQVPGCTRHAHMRDREEKWQFRKSLWVRQKYGVKPGYVCEYHHMERLAYENGYAGDITAFKNSYDAWMSLRENQCSNRDGHLGFKCRFEPPTFFECLASGIATSFRGYLENDHDDGNPYNNDPENSNTYCANCHRFKTHINKDWATPGRKTLKKLAIHGRPVMFDS